MTALRADDKIKAERKSSGARSLLRELLLFMAAGPAAVGLVGQINGRVDFSEILVRIIANYNRVVDAIWHVIWSIIGVEVDPFIGRAATGLLLVCLPILMQSMTSRRPERNLYQVLAAFYSSAFILLVFVGFGIKEAVFLAFSGVLTYYGMSFLSTFSALGAQIDKYPKITLATITLLTAIVFAVSGFRAHYAALTASYENIVAWLVLAFVFPLSLGFAARGVLRGANGPLYVLIFSVGMMFFDWLAVSVRPAIGEWLTSIGA